MSEEGEDRKERKQCWDAIRANAYGILGEDCEYSSGGNGGGGPRHGETVGICATCQHYNFAENDLGQVVYSRCNEFDRDLGRNRIVNCSNYEELGRLSLRSMFDIAHIINADNKTKIGF